MLDKISIRNYRCLRSVDVPLKPLTVLIGPNDSGKTAFLSALLWLSRFQPGINESDVWGFTRDATVSINVWANGNAGILHSIPNAKVDKQQILPWMSPTELFRLPPSGIQMKCEGRSESIHTLGEDGRDLAAVLDALLRTDRTIFFQVVNTMKELVPGLLDINITTPESNTRRIEFITDHSLTIQGDYLSSGVRIILFFVTLALYRHRPRLILIEEPENGIHPRRLAKIMDILHLISSGNIGGCRSQVILTTHSPYVLDLVDKDKDEVLVFSRNDDGSRTASPLDRERLDPYFQHEFSLGDIWYNLQERGMV